MLYRRQASASVSESAFPAWASTQLKDRVMHYWSEGQTWLLRETLAGRSGVLLTDSCGRTSQVTPSSDEVAKLGAGVRTFVSYSGKPELAQGDSSSYTDPFRIAIKADNIVRTSGNQGTMDVKLMFTNQTNHTMYLRGFEFNYNIMGITPGQTTHYSVGGGNDNPDTTLITSYIPGRSTSVITRRVNIFGVDNAAYTVAQMRVVPYFVRGGNVTYQYGSLATNQEIISCFIEPFDIRELGGGSIAYSMPAEPSVTYTKTYVSPAIPSRTSTVTVAPSPSVSPSPTTATYQLHKGFNVFGSNIPIDAEIVKNAGLSLYKFDGPGNKWQVYPGDQKFETKAFKGYYIYAPQATSINLSYGLYLAVTHQVERGWNLLWTNQNKNLQNLILTIDGTSKTAQAWMQEGKINNKIFEIANDQSSNACGYFKILSTQNIPADCSAGNLETVDQITSGKNFWVYVY